MEQQSTGALTARDLNRLESGFLDSSPTRGFQDFLVTLPDRPDFPFELPHRLSPELPTGVRYEVLQSVYPVVLYHNPDDAWGINYVVLRATVGGGAQIRIRLTVDDGDAEPLLEGASDGIYAQDQLAATFPSGVQTVGRRVNANPFVARLDATGSTNDQDGNAFGATSLGPALILDGGKQDSVWAIQNDIIFGSSDSRLVFKSSRDAVDWAMALHPGPLNLPANTYYLIPSVGGTLNLGASSSEVGVTSLINRIRATEIHSTNGYYERGRSVAAGEWTNVAFNAANFTANGAMTWTVASGDQSTYAYSTIGTTMHLKVQVLTSSIGGTPSTALRIAIPGGFTSTRSWTGVGLTIKDSGSSAVHEVCLVNATAGNNFIELYLLGAPNWPATTNTTNVYVDVEFEVT